MNDGSSAAVGRVILVAPDDGEEAPISLSAEIAAAFQAELNGLFIRDQRLRDLAASPFAQILAPGGGAKRSLTSKAIESAWMRNEQWFRRAVTDRASERKVSCSFRSAEGAFSACLLEGVDRRDLIAIAVEPTPVGSGSQIGIVRGAAKQAHSVLLMVRTARRRDPPRHAPIVVLYTQVEHRRRRILDMATRLSRATGRSVIELSTGDSAPGQSPQSVRYVAGRSAHDFVSATRRLAPALIIADVHQAGSDDEKQDDDLVNAFLRGFSAPLLLLAAD